MTKILSFGAKYRWMAVLVSVAAGGALFVYGIFRDEIGEVLFNAAML